jgi:hypothetical protein
VSTAILPILEAAVLVVTAPLCGVALATRRFRGSMAAAALFALLLAVSAAWTLTSWGRSPDALRAVLVSHATLAVTGLALAALGGWFGSTFRDPLDAAAFSAGAALVAALGLFAAGPLVADLPTGIVNAALSASPIVATASAADVDLLRTDLLYRVSPLAHRRFEYPRWYSPLVWYGVLLLVSIAGIVGSLRRGASSHVHCH